MNHMNKAMKDKFSKTLCPVFDTNGLHVVTHLG